MASILRVNTLTDASSNNSTAMSTINQGTAKAWVNLNGTGTIAARDSFNIASLTDSGTGKYDLNYTNNMGNSSYVVSTMSNNLDGNDDGNQRISGERKSNTRSTSMTPVQSGDWFYVASQTFVDGQHYYASIHGDLA